MSDILIWDDVALRSALRTMEGRDLGQRAIRVESAAKINASHARPSVRGSGPAVRSGRLRASISWRLGEDYLGIYADIGSSLIYAERVEVEYDRPYLRPALEAARS